MRSERTLTSAFVGSFHFLLLWALFSLLFPVFSDVQENEKDKEELITERSVVKGGDNITQRVSGLEMEGVSAAADSLPQCVNLAYSQPLALQMAGNVVIGGIFPLHYVAPKPQHSYQSKPNLSTCSG